MIVTVRMQQLGIYSDLAVAGELSVAKETLNLEIFNFLRKNVLMTHRSTWKALELRLAKFFNTKRQICSGSMGRTDQTMSDSVHPLLFIEAKYRQKFAIIELWKECHVKMKIEGKELTIVALKRKGLHSDFLLIRKEDLLPLAQLKMKEDAGET